jgi:glycosyltransferase 2 family protein
MKAVRWALRSRLLKMAAAIVLLAAIYRAADWTAVATRLGELEMKWLGLGLLLFIPQTLVSAWRWQWLVRPVCTISLAESMRQTLAASALNLVTPSKLGDLSKAAMLPSGGAQRAAKACGVVAIEKGADVAALLLLLAAGYWAGNVLLVGGLFVMICMPAAVQWAAVNATFLSRACSLAAISLALWILHLAQIDCFLRAAGVHVPWTTSFARIPVAIFAGLLPVSFCGLGTRDAALVWRFADVAPAATMAGVGMLTALRYLVPGLLGIPCLRWPPADGKCETLLPAEPAPVGCTR